MAGQLRNRAAQGDGNWIVAVRFRAEHCTSGIIRQFSGGGRVWKAGNQLADLEKGNAELAARNEELSRRIEELEKKNPTVRLDEAFSMRAEEKLAEATLEEDVWPKQFKFKECQWRYSRPVWRILNGQAGLAAYHIYAGKDYMPV